MNTARMSELYVPTLKEEPAEAEIPSHRILLRAGMIRKVAAGVYVFLPLARRSLLKIENVIREEMDRIGCQELLMPAIQPAELWRESGRWDDYGPELMRLQDRHGREFCLGPTHEEVITALVRHEMRSYRDLPKSLYQIQVKFRDEIRPRFGLLRSREFIMKDAYSFHADQESLQEHYDAQSQAYGRFCARLGLDYRPVEAESGQIGGSVTTEFMALAETGEAELVYCSSCEYAANVDAARSVLHREPMREQADMSEVHTPDARSISEVAGFLGVPEHRTVKTLAAVADDRLVLFSVPGDRDLNPVKAQWAVPGARLLDEDEFDRYGLVMGFVGPVGALAGALIVADQSLRDEASWIVGANKADHHLTGASPGRDFSVDEWADLVVARPGDGCPACGGELLGARGIEVGQVFQLGTKYSESMGATFTAEDGTEKPFIMGCYGIGVTRALAAVIEQHADENGVAWPVSVAPYEVAVLPLGDGEVADVAESVLDGLASAGVEVVIDDRDERPGVKFADADLIGFPYQVVVGKRSLGEGAVEVKDRKTGERATVPLDDVVEHVAGLVERDRAALLPD
ncbi:MAG: proline--tRNA ligase [Coriobacteriia bacterium]